MKLLYLKCALLFTLFSGLSATVYPFFLMHLHYNDRDRIQSGMIHLQVAGLRLAALQLKQFSPQQQQDWLNNQSLSWPGSLTLQPVAELPASEASSLQHPDGFVCRYRNGFIEYVMVAADRDKCLQWGPLLTVSQGFIEAEARGTLALLKQLAADPAVTPGQLQTWADQCGLPIQIRRPQELPADVTTRLPLLDQPVMFFEQDDCFLAQSVPDKNYVLRAGPLTKVRKVAWVTIYSSIAANAIIFAPIATLAFFVASRRFSRVEKAARVFAAGNLDVRVDEKAAGEAADLARTFNIMASRTADSMRAKTQLLQLVSHELRTPLTRLRFAMELLDSSDSPQQKHQRMSTINNSLDDLEAIVAEVLDFVRHERSARLDSQSWLSIPAALQTFQVSFKDEKDGVLIVWNQSAAESVDQVYADRRAFQHVLRNLIGNAWRYAQNTIQVSACSSPLPADTVLNGRNSARPQQQPPSDVPCVCVTVEDDGPGMPISGRSEALAPLHSLDAQIASTNSVNPRSDRAQHGGYGLGLAIVKRLVEQHGGAIEIGTSSLGGCRIRTWWPSQDVTAETTT